MLTWLMDLFWTESLWLPADIKWQDIANDPSKNVVYTETKEFLYHIPTTLVLLAVRYVLQKYCFAPLGKSLGVKGKRVTKAHVMLESQQHQLEEAYRTLPRNKDLAALAKKLQLSERQVERWWRDRRRQDRASPLDKFCEHAWKSTYLLTGTVFGLYVLWDKEWLRDFEHLYIGFPHQGVTNDMWWYHVVTSSYCWCLLITHFTEPAGKRSDTVLMFLHHVIELLLLASCWVVYGVRIMTVLVPLTNVSEMMLEVTKTLLRTEMKKATEISYAATLVVWFTTRMYILPVHLLYSLTFRGPSYVINMPFMAYFTMAMLYILQIQQVYWSWLILRVVYNYFANGTLKDVRSSCSEDWENAEVSKYGAENNTQGQMADRFKTE